MAWPPQEAKQRFSEVVGRALTEGPQWVTRHGRRVVVVAAEDFESSANRQSFTPQGAGRGPSPPE